MPVHVTFDGLRDATSQPLSQAITDAVGQRSGKWDIKIQEVAEKEAWDVRIEGPDEFEWSHRFEGVERDGTIIGNSIRVAIEMSVGGLIKALSELALQGVPFTSERRTDGGTDY